MNNIVTLLLILVPMFVGFMLPKNHRLAVLGERTLNILVFLILIVIGIELGLVDDLADKLGAIALYLSVLFILTVGSSLLVLGAFDRLFAYSYHHNQQSQAKATINLKSSLIQIGYLALGFGIGTSKLLHPPAWTTTALLMLLLFLVGLLLKNANIGLKEALFNRRGLYISLIFMAGVLASGLLFAALFEEVSWSKGLALASGFGWYSLSGVIMTDAYGALWGSVALLNDLLREVAALLFIPYVMRLSSSAAIGLAGVTSLDFTLPTLQKSGGNEIVPLVISFGFITNVVSPILMVFFSSLDN